MAQTAFFRFEASPTIGAGHAIRSGVLADALVEKGWNCKIVSNSESYQFIKSLERFERLNPESFHQTPQTADLLVIDHYELDEKYEKHFRSHAEKILVIEDHANRQHQCDLLVDQVFWHTEKHYSDLVPSSCKLLIGSGYTILRKELTSKRSASLEKRKNTQNIKHLLINFGGGNQTQHLLSALHAIKRTSFHGKISIVLGFSNFDTNFFPIFQEIAGNNQLYLYNSTSMADRIFEADLAIGSAAGSFVERCLLGLPSILYDVALHQGVLSSMLRKINCPGAKVVDDLGVSLTSALEDCLKTQYQILFESVLPFCDPNGVKRIVDNMQDLLT